MTLTPEEITENFDKFRSLCEKLGERSPAALAMVDHLGERLALCPASGRIINRFGRPLQVDPEAKNLFVNTYVQSTGVDVAMIGFNSIIEKLGKEGVRPLFVLHDALILDVKSDRKGDIEKITSIKIPSYELDFPLKLEIQ